MLSEETLFENFKTRFDREVVHLMKNTKIPGMSVKITLKGETFYERNYGSREVKEQKPATSDTIYGIASMTKSITCVAILMLQEQGKLNIQDPVNKYVPIQLGFKDHPITIHNLMSHSSGIPNLGTYLFPITNEELNWVQRANIPMNNWDDFYFHINDAKDEIISEPGKKYYYSNDSFTILSQIIEKVSSVPYEEFVKINILEKLHMDKSTYFRKDLEHFDDVSVGYDDSKENKKLKRKPKPHTTGPFNSGAGGLNSTVNDLTKYLQFHLRKGLVNGEKILSEDLLQQMYMPHNKNSQMDRSLLGLKGDYYGYGLATVEDFLGKKILYHGGSSGVSGGVLCFVPELELTYVQLQNITTAPNYLYALALCLIMGQEPDEVIPFFRRRKHYAGLVGHYAAYKNILELDIYQKNGLLYMREKDTEESLPLIPSNDEPEVLDFYIVTDFGKLEIPFQKRNGEVLFDYERNILHKVSYNKEEFT